MTGHKKGVFLLIIGSFLLLTGLYSVKNSRMVYQSIGDYIKQNITIGELKKDLTEKMNSSRLLYRDELIELNGFYGKISGRRRFNDAVLMKNGMLAESKMEIRRDSVTDQDKADGLSEFNDFVSSYGGRFLFAVFPNKTDMENKLLPDGLESKIVFQTEMVLDLFREKGIDVIDTLAEFSGNAAKIEANYYRTDHHWKPAAAFRAYQMIMDRLIEIFPDETYDTELMKIENWTIHEMPDQFLGSLGKRTGKSFAGLDSLQWLTPDFDTEVSFYSDSKGGFRRGDFEEAFLRNKFLEPNNNYLHTDNYFVYIGRNFPLNRINNLLAPSGQKLLLIIDSYGIPLQTFLSMQFCEVDVIDPRFYDSGSLIEYVDRTRPDIVLTMLNTPSLKYAQYFLCAGENDVILSDERILLKEASVRIDPENDSYNHTVLYDHFENGRYYTLSLPEILVTDGSAEGVTLSIFDTKNKKTVCETVFDTAWCNKYGSCEWTFRAPENGSRDVQLFIFAGLRDNTTGVGISYNGVKIYERVPE